MKSFSRTVLKFTPKIIPKTFALILLLIASCAHMQPSPELLDKLDDAHFPGNWRTDDGMLDISCRGGVRLKLNPSTLDEVAGLLAFLDSGETSASEIQNSVILDFWDKGLRVDDGIFSQTLDIEELPTRKGEKFEMRIEGRRYTQEKPLDCRSIL